VPGPALVEALLGHMADELLLYDYDELTQVGAWLGLGCCCGYLVCRWWVRRIMLEGRFGGSSEPHFSRMWEG
jgi:hypothetical protein